MEVREYLKDPCSASSLPFWKTQRYAVPEGVTVVRDDVFSRGTYSGTDERYFRMIHDLSRIREVSLPDRFRLADPDPERLAAHISSCYERERISAQELLEYRTHPVFDPDLWIAVEDCRDGSIVASGIAEADMSIGEGILEWIQVSPDRRREGLGTFVVCELLRRMRGKTEFATVSGRMDSGSRPYELYRSCGFTGTVIWHVITE